MHGLENRMKKKKQKIEYFFFYSVLRNDSDARTFHSHSRRMNSLLCLTSSTVLIYLMLEYELHAPKPSIHSGRADVFRRLPHTLHLNEWTTKIRTKKKKEMKQLYICIPLYIFDIKGRFILFRFAHWQAVAPVRIYFFIIFFFSFKCRRCRCCVNGLCCADENYVCIRCFSLFLRPFVSQLIGAGVRRTRQPRTRQVCELKNWNAKCRNDYTRYT